MPDDQNIPDHMNGTPPPSDEGDYGADVADTTMPEKTAKIRHDLTRTPPCNFEAEKALLGALMANNRAYEKIDFLKPFHFADPIHSTVFEAMERQIDAGRVCDVITLKEFFERDKQLAEIGGNEYLVELAASCVTIINATEYARIIYDLYIKRELIYVGTEIVNNAHSGTVDTSAQQQREWAEAKLFELGETSAAQSTRSRDDIVSSTLSELKAAYEKKGQIDGLRTGLNAVDRILGGIPPSSLTILAGRPGMGKTAIAAAIGYNSATFDQPAPAAFFSLEMGAEQINKRLVSDKAAVPHSMMRSGSYNNDKQFEDVILATQHMKNVALFFDDSANLSVADIKARLRRMIRMHGVKMCIIDYLTHIRPRDPKSPKVYQVEQITRDLKAMAKEFRVPVVLLCQLSRAVEQREDKRPILSDLRDSGAIEQDADQVLFAYRKAYYLEREEPEKRNNESSEAFMDRQNRHEAELNRCERLCEIIIAKNRHGSTGTANIFFDPAYQRVRDIYQDQGGIY